MEEITQLYKEFRTIDGIGVCKVYKPHLTNQDLYSGSSYLIEEGFELDVLLEDINDDLFNDNEDDSPYHKIPKRY